LQQKKTFLVSFVIILVFAFLSVQPAFAYSDVKLKSEMSGDAVSNLQKELKTLGFMNIDPTGYFGEITKAAVMKFQNKYNLTPDGIAGPKTLGRIDGLTGRTVAISRGNSVSTSLQIIDYAKKFLGVEYVWGGMSPNGFDCSGFVKYVFGRFGIDLNRVAADQAKQGTPVKKADLLPGDLVFFDMDGGHVHINHVGLYIGNGRFIQASSGKSSVVISDITHGAYAEDLMTAKRIL